MVPLVSLCVLVIKILASKNIYHKDMKGIKIKNKMINKILLADDLTLMYSEGSPSAYIYFVTCYCVIVVPYVRSGVVSLHTVTILMVIINA